MSDKILKVPYGTRDILPGEGAVRRGLEDRIGRLFNAWGYDEVDTPTFEYVDTFSNAGNPDLTAFKFLDRNGHSLMLRTDMTAPIARMVATRFRRDTGAEADAEVIALAVQTLLEVGLQDFSISLGQMEFINGLIEAAALNESQARDIKQCLIKRNVVGLGETVAAAGIPKQLADIFRELLFLHGGVELLDDMQGRVLSRRCWNALENLRKIYDLCREYGVEQYLSFDLGLTRSLDYYTGMLFEGYAAGMGYSLIGGGRYDTMMQQFGSPCPATGFALGIERILLTLQRQETVQLTVPPALFIAYAPGRTADAIRLAMQLRRQGQRVKVATFAMDEAEVQNQARINKCDTFRYVKE